MAFTQVGAVNLALFHIKQSQITSMTESTVAAQTANAVYEYILKEVLERFDWKFAAREEELTLDETWNSTGKWDYRYNKPTEECLRISRLRDEDNIKVPYEQKGDYIYTNYDNDLGDAIAEDDMSADNTADWADDGANISLAFDTDHYEVTTDAVNKNAWLADKSVTEGRSYKLSIKLKDGTASSKQVEFYFDDGDAQYSSVFTSSSVKKTISATFKCANTTDEAKLGIRVVDSLASSNLELTDFSAKDGGEDPLYMEFVTYEDDPTEWTALFVNAFAYRLAAAMANKLAPSMESDMMNKYELALLDAKGHNQAQDGQTDDEGNDDWLTAGRS